ncbi:hypothetical protein ACQKCJ_11520 [Flavobacterium sp. NPDC079362]|uniref:hypothetical protein n=1 Tax=Flavobacterium sp. NPDC079362 TaxID=3390566 RepID=UPI003D027EAD
MQALLTTFCFLFFTYNLSLAQTNHNDLKDVNLKGSVKSFGKCLLEGTSIPLAVENKICRMGIGNTYNEKGFLISSNSISYNASIVEINYHYNTKGDLSATDYYYPEKKTSNSYLVTVKYDSAKNEVSYWFYWENILQSKTIFIRDNKGNLIVEQNYDANGKLNTEKRYEYDVDNYKIKESFWSIRPPGYLDKPTFESVVTYHNDERGNPVIKIDSASKEKTTYVYQYDNVGNWLLCTAYNDKGQIKQVTEQYFEYY